MKKLLCSLGIVLVLVIVIDAGEERILRDANGKIVATVQETATGQVVRDGNGKIVGRITTERPTSNVQRPTSNGEKK